MVLINKDIAPFEISQMPFGSYTLCQILNRLTGEYFSFFPELGASFHQLVLKGKDGEKHSLLLGNRDFDALTTEGKKMYNGSKLFPFPNRVYKGCYAFDGREYQLPINEMPGGNALHGLVYDSVFHIMEADVSKEEGVVALEYLYNRNVEGYPFKVRLRIRYCVTKDGFSCNTLVKNEDREDVPISDGWHPYFKLDSPLEDYCLTIPSVEEVELDEHMIPTGHLIRNDSFLEGKRIGTGHYDTCFRLNPELKRSNVLLRDGNSNWAMNLWLESPYRYVQIYTPPQRGCMAIEPMATPANAFNSTKDLIILKPDQVMEFEWGINLIDIPS